MSDPARIAPGDWLILATNVGLVDEVVGRAPTLEAAFALVANRGIRPALVVEVARVVVQP